MINIASRDELASQADDRSWREAVEQTFRQEIMESMVDLVDKCLQKNIKTVVVGDFNYPVKSDYDDFCAEMHGLGLNQRVSSPTRAANLLDLVFSGDGILSDVTVKNAIIASDHSTVLFSVNEAVAFAAAYKMETTRFDVQKLNLELFAALYDKTKNFIYAVIDINHRWHVLINLLTVLLLAACRTRRMTSVKEMKKVTARVLTSDSYTQPST